MHSNWKDYLDIEKLFWSTCLKPWGAAIPDMTLQNSTARLPCKCAKDLPKLALQARMPCSWVPDVLLLRSQTCSFLHGVTEEKLQSCKLQLHDRATAAMKRCRCAKLQPPSLGSRLGFTSTWNWGGNLGIFEKHRKEPGLWSTRGFSCHRLETGSIRMHRAEPPQPAPLVWCHFLSSGVFARTLAAWWGCREVGATQRNTKRAAFFSYSYSSLGN